MGKEKDFYDVAEEYYVKQGKTLGELGQLISVSPTTLGKWKAKGEWGRKRKDYLTRTRQGPVERLRDRLDLLLQETEVLDSKTVDTISKIIAAIEKIEGGRDLFGSTIEVMGKFVEYIQANEDDEEFVSRLTDHLQGFFNYVKGMR